MANAVGYTRISSIGQRTVDGSLRIQEQVIRNKCSSEGWNLLELFTDDGKSGTSIAGRPDFQRAIKFAEERLQKGDRFIVATDTRFGRNGPELIALSQRFFDLGIILVAADSEYGNLDYQSEYDWFDNLLKAARESRRNSAETTRNMRLHASHGRYQSKAVFGYRNTSGAPGKSLEVVPEQAEVVKWLFEAYSQGAEITDLASQIGTFSSFANRRRRTARAMTHNQLTRWISETLRRNVYQGYLREKRTDNLPVRGDWKAIVADSQVSGHLVSGFRTRLS